MQSDHFAMHGSLESRHWWFVARRQIVGRLVDRLLGREAGRRIVDVGCGTGGVVGSLWSGYDRLGIEPSPAGIAEARRDHPDVRFLEGTFSEHVGDASKPGALYLLLDVLEHVEDDRGLLAEVIAAARGGGHILITVPADRKLWSPHDVAYGHFRRYDRDLLTALWAGHGVRTRMVSYFNTLLYPPILAVRTVTRFVRRSVGEANTDVALPPAPLNEGLRRLFAAEGSYLEAVLDGHRPPLPFGVSLLAIVEVP